MSLKSFHTFRRTFVYLRLCSYLFQDCFNLLNLVKLLVCKCCGYIGVSAANWPLLRYVIFRQQITAIQCSTPWSTSNVSESGCLYSLWWCHWYVSPPTDVPLYVWGVFTWLRALHPALAVVRLYAKSLLFPSLWHRTPCVLGGDVTKLFPHLPA